MRRVLRHETLAMSLRYAHLAEPDVTRKFRRRVSQPVSWTKGVEQAGTQ
jgi:hypothetical protein